MSCESLINLLARLMLFLLLSLLLADSTTMSCNPGKDYRLGITSIDQTNSTTKGAASVNETVSFICSSRCGSISYYIFYIDDRLESHKPQHYATRNDEVYFQGINAHLYFEANYTTEVDCSLASDGISAKLILTPRGVGLYHVYCLNQARYDNQRHYYNVYSEISQVKVKRDDSDPVTFAYSSQERTSSKMPIPSSSENIRPTTEPNRHSTCYDASDMMMTAVTTQTSIITTTETVILTSYTTAATSAHTTETVTLTTFASSSYRTVAVTETSRPLQPPHLSSSPPDLALLQQSNTGSSENIAKANTVLISVCIASAALVIMLSVVISTISIIAARCTVKKMQRNDLTVATTAVNPSVVSEP